jgi:hypothetical protein
MTPLALTDVLADIPDPRGRNGRRHPLPAVLGLVAVGFLMGRKTLEGIAQLARDHGPALAHALGFTRTPPPESALSRTLRRLDPDAVEAALARWVRSRLPADADVLSVDGKVARGSRDGEVPGHHLLSAYAPHVEAVVGQVRVAATTNEHKAALRLLGVLPVAGRVVVGDAMFTHPDVCRAVRDGGGDYVLIVKDNQPALKVGIAAGFAFEGGAFSPRRGAAAGPREARHHRR